MNEASLSTEPQAVRKPATEGRRVTKVMLATKKRPGELEIAGAKAEPRHSEDDKEPMGKHSTPTLDIEAIRLLNGLPEPGLLPDDHVFEERDPAWIAPDFTDDELADVRAKWYGEQRKIPGRKPVAGNTGRQPTAAGGA